MKKLIVTLVACMACITASAKSDNYYLNVTTGEVTENLDQEYFTFEYEILDNGYAGDLTINYIRLSESLGAYRTYIDDWGPFDYSDKYPDIPIKTYPCRVLEEYKPSVKLTIDSIPYYDYNFELAPGRNIISHHSPLAPQTKSFRFDIPKGFFPENVYDITDIYPIFGIKDILNLTFFPIRYDQDTHTVRIAHRIVFKLTFDNDQTGIEATPEANSLTVSGGKGCLNVSCVESGRVTVYSLTGMVVAEADVHDTHTFENLTAGTYIVTSGGKTRKALVR